MHFLNEPQPGFEKKAVIIKEGIDDQNDDNDIDEPQDILEDVDKDNDDDEDNNNEDDIFSLYHKIRALK